MKNRFLITGLIALVVGACGDDVQVVEPTPPPPPPLTATMAPASATVAVGNNVVFAVNASGGAAGAQASWTCASSNTGIATASNAGAGCQATGVAAGSVTITAAVTKGSETLNVGAQLTVTEDVEDIVVQPPGNPAFLLVASVEGKDDTDASGLEGRVEVVLNVERGDQTLEMLSLLVDGAVVEFQSFGTSMGMTPPEDEAAEQAVHAFTLAFDSHDYDRDTGAATYVNGEHTISAELQIQGGMMADGMMGHATISSNEVAVEFKNSDFIAASVSGLGEGAMNSSTGQVWYGGPDASVEISALPVLYSSGGVSSLTLLTFCGDDAATDSEAPFSFEVDCGGWHSGADGDTPSFNAGGSQIDSEGGEVYLDFKGPEAPNFSVNPNKREDGWVNADVDFTGEQKSSNKDGWLDYNEDGSDAGVGGYAPQIRFAEADDDVSVALGAPALPSLVLPPALAGQSSKVNAFCVVVSAVDILGNESGLPDADEDCVSWDEYATTDDDDVTTYAAGLLAGADLAPPTIVFSPASPKANATTVTNFQVQVADEGSGIRATDPVTAEAHVRDADGSDELDDLEVNVELPLATTADLPGDMGYYTFTAETADKAGNSSGEVTRTALHDTTVPQTSTIVGAYDTKTGSYSLIATVTDNLSIKEYWAETRFAASPGGLTITNNLFLPREGGVAVDAYNADDLTTSTLASSFTAQTFQGIQTAGDITSLASIGVFARDNADRLSAGALVGDGTDAVAVTFDPVLSVDDDGFDITAGTIDVADDDNAAAVADSVDAGDRKVFQTLTADAGVKSGTVELEATATGTLFTAPTAAVFGDDPGTTDVVETDFVTTDAVDGTQGLRDNPISRVDFYAAVDAEDGGNGRTALKFIGSVNGATAGAEDFDSEDGTDDGTNDSRRYIYSLEMSEAAFLAIVGGDDDYGEDGTGDALEDVEGAIIAIAVGDNENVGFSSAAVALVVEE